MQHWFYTSRFCFAPPPIPCCVSFLFSFVVSSASSRRCPPSLTCPPVCWGNQLHCVLCQYELTWYHIYLQLGNNLIMTHCEVVTGSHSQSQTKLKVVKWGFKKWNQHILVYIYAKQYEILQKKSMKKLKRPKSLFLQWEVSSSVLKTWKTRETKT